METLYSQNPAMFRNNPIGFIVAVLLIPLAVGILILLWWYLQCKASKLEITGRDVVLETGLLSKEHIELNVDSIRSVRISQSFFNRLFGVGRIAIFSAGDSAEMVAAGMPDPHDFREIVKKLQRERNTG